MCLPGLNTDDYNEYKLQDIGNAIDPENNFLYITFIVLELVVYLQKKLVSTVKVVFALKISVNSYSKMMSFWHFWALVMSVGAQVDI